MPHGISGLLIAAILAAAMSNLSAALSALSSSTILDVYLRLRPQIEEHRRMTLSRLTTVVWAAILLVIAVLLCLHPAGRVIELGLQIASISYGALLGVFLLGVLTQRANQNGAMLGMVCGFGAEVYLWKFTLVPWTWWVAIGAGIRCGIGYLASATFAARRAT